MPLARPRRRPRRPPAGRGPALQPPRRSRPRRHRRAARHSRRSTWPWSGGRRSPPSGCPSPAGTASATSTGSASRTTGTCSPTIRRSGRPSGTTCSGWPSSGWSPPRSGCSSPSFSTRASGSAASTRARSTCRWCSRSPSSASSPSWSSRATRARSTRSSAAREPSDRLDRRPRPQHLGGAARGRLAAHRLCDDPLSGRAEVRRPLAQGGRRDRRRERERRCSSGCPARRCGRST